MDYVFAIDQGTTDTTAVLCDRDMNTLAEASVEFGQIFPRPGWVEHDLNEIWTTVLQTVREVLKHIDPRKVAGLGISNQRATICFWDRLTGEALAPAIVWQDRRTRDFCATLKNEGLAPLFESKTGLVLDPYFSGTKISWALENWPEVSRAYKEKRLAVGTIDSFLIFKLSGGAVHTTEPSNASRTLCFDLTKRCWNEELCRALRFSPDILPDISGSIGVIALTQGVPGLPDGIPITASLGDQQAALLGQACIHQGQSKCSFGTGAALLTNMGRRFTPSQNRMTCSVAWVLDDDYTFALEGDALVAGSAIQWVRDGLRFIQDTAEIETLAETVSSSDGVFFVPSLTGMGAPYWDASATGMFTGITRGTTQAHLARAVLEGIAFEIADIAKGMEKDLGKPLVELNVDGSASANDLLMQIQCDILGIPLQRPKTLNAAALGTAFAAALGAGIITDLSDIEKLRATDRVFQPASTDEQRAERFEAWKTAVSRAVRT